MKKKLKRVDARQGRPDPIVQFWQNLQDSGALVSALMLVAFVVFGSLLMSLHFDSDETGAKSLYLSQYGTLFGILLLMTAMLGLYVSRFEPSLLKEHYQAGSLLGLMLVMIALVQLGVLQGWWTHLLIVPVLLTAIITTIAYSQRFALAMGSYMVLLGAFMAHEQLSFLDGFALVLITGCAVMVAVTCLREIRSRSYLIQVCSLAGGTVFILIWVVGLYGHEDPRDIFGRSMVGMLSAIGVGFFVQGILPLVERVFFTATSMRLLDYSDANRPLLQRLAVEAPGTFHHSMQIGMLAEAAADAIGANGLLCRVGSYYHDIGKLNKPHFFVENQGESYSQHKGLSPTMSKMIIIGHVKDGLEMAADYKLPKVLHQFIATHHGTTLVEYFFHEAHKIDGDGGRPPNEADFRYPGPKPQNRETAIVMLCDAVEGASRALADPTPTRIENIVNTLLMKRLLDGQFDECNITMKELRLVESRVVSTLCGMYHGRIAYPTGDPKKKDDAKDDTKKERTEDQPSKATAISSK